MTQIHRLYRLQHVPFQRWRYWLSVAVSVFATAILLDRPVRLQTQPDAAQPDAAQPDAAQHGLPSASRAPASDQPAGQRAAVPRITEVSTLAPTPARPVPPGLANPLAPDPNAAELDTEAAGVLQMMVVADAPPRAESPIDRFNRQRQEQREAAREADPSGAPAARPPITAPAIVPIQLSPYLATGTLSRQDYEDRPQGWPIDTLVLHHTALSQRMPIAQVTTSWQNSPAEVSAHFLIGPAGDIVMAVPPSRTAFHILKQANYRDPVTGQPINWINLRSIGLEFQYDPRTERPTSQQVIMGGRLIGVLFNAYPDLDVLRIIGHGVQSFVDNPNGRMLSEPTGLFLDRQDRVHPNFLLLLTSAAEVSPEIAQAIAEAGGVEALAAMLRQQTIAGQQLTRSLSSQWTRESNLPVSPITPADALWELQMIAAGMSWAHPVLNTAPPAPRP